MRILHVQKVTGIGGCERHLLSLLPALAAHGVNPRMCVMVAGNGHLFVDQLRLSGIDVEVVSAGPTPNPVLPFVLARIIRGFDPELVHTHLIHGFTYGQPAARLMGKPSVASMHSAHSFFHRQPFRFATRSVLRYAERVIAISEFVAQFVVEERLASASRIRVIPYGVEPVEHTSRKSDAKSSPVTVCVASRLIEGKGHSLLIEAFSRVARGGLKLLIAGDGPLRGTLEKHARQMLPTSAYRFLGHVNNTRAVMADCDVVVIPTDRLAEGFGLVALEAMAESRPVIATSLGALPEVVRHKETGLVVAPAVEPMADAIEALARDHRLRAQMGAAGRRRALEIFSLDRMVDKTLAVYEEARSPSR